MTTADEQVVRDQTVALIQAYQTLITEQRFEEWIELWADDGVCEFPFAAESRPNRLCGKKEILENMTQYPGASRSRALMSSRCISASTPMSPWWN